MMLDTIVTGRACLLSQRNVMQVSVLTLCMLGNFSCFCCRLLTFFKKITFSKNSFRNTIECKKV